MPMSVVSGLGQGAPLQEVSNSGSASIPAPDMGEDFEKMLGQALVNVGQSLEGGGGDNSQIGQFLVSQGNAMLQRAQSAPDNTGGSSSSSDQVATPATGSDSATSPSPGTAIPNKSVDNTAATASAASSNGGSAIPAASTGALATGASGSPIQTLGQMQGSTQYLNMENDSDQTIYMEVSGNDNAVNGGGGTAVNTVVAIGAHQTATVETGSNFGAERAFQVDSSGNEIDPGHEALTEDAIINGKHNEDISDVDTGMTSPGVNGPTNTPNQAMTFTSGDGVSAGNAFQGTGHGAYLASNDDAVLNGYDGGKLDPMVGASDNTNTINVSISPNSQNMTNGAGVPTGSDAPI